MTADERTTLRMLIDRRRRELVSDEPSCSGCGCHVDERTARCRTCWDRHRNRRRNRADPEAARTRWRAAHRRRRALRGPGVARLLVCAGCGVSHDEETPGCANCRKRHWMRHMRKRWDA